MRYKDKGGNKMAKKKASTNKKTNKRIIKTKKAKKAPKKKVVKAKPKKALKASPKKGTKKAAALKIPKEKPIGKLTHYFDKISVAALKVIKPMKVGDIIRIKGHVTDFVQRIDSMQLEHQSITVAKKGDEIGIKAIEKVRDHDFVYAATEKDLAVKPVIAQQAVAQPEPQAPATEQKFLKF